MQSLSKSNTRPEARIARECDSYLKARGWWVKKTHGNRYQRGFPDRYVFHREHGVRWIDYKAPHKNEFTPAQQKEWPDWSMFGGGIWIMTEASDSEYRKLFGPANFRDFWKPRYGSLEIDNLLAALVAGGEG